jgi:outer membrane protein OmpA-like peptidoglycan-associated protein
MIVVPLIAWALWAAVPAHAEEPPRIRVTDTAVVLSAPIAFEYGKAVLTEPSLPTIASIAALLEAEPTMTLRIEVHTDSQGADEYNLQLSQARAEAIRDAIVQQGTRKGRIEAVGYGETRPLATNATAEGRAQNRRVVIAITHA